MDSPWRWRLAFAAHYAGVGISLAYLSPWLVGLGLGGALLGTAQMLGPLLGVPFSLALTRWAERHHAERRALTAASLLQCASLAAMSLTRDPLLVGGLLVLSGIAGAPVVPLIDAQTLAWLRTHPGTPYGRIRLFGSLGYVATAQGLGLLLTARGDRSDDATVPLGLALAAGTTLLLSLLLPSTRPTGEASKGSAQPLEPLGRGYRRLVALCTAHWVACAPYHLLFGLFVKERGLPASLLGLAMSVGVAAEVAVMALAGRLERRFPIQPLLATVFGLTAVRWIALSQSTSAVAVVGLQALHGATFGLFWVTAVRALGGCVPPGRRTSAQALFGAIVFSLSSAIAYPPVGEVAQRLGDSGPLFLAGGLLELLLAAVVLLPAFRLSN